MAIRKIRKIGDPVLRTKCSEIVSITDKSTQTLVKDLQDTLLDIQGAGLAANQIGVSLRAFAYLIDGELGYILNPVLITVSGEKIIEEEGCLSIPGLFYKNSRYEYAKVEGVDLSGAKIILDGKGLIAKALQHEMEHLDGKLFVDKLDKDTRKLALREIRNNFF